MNVMRAGSGSCSDEGRCPSGSACIRRHVCRFRRVAGATVTRCTFARGERIPPAGPDRARFHVVRDGMVASAAVMSDGRRQLMCFHVAGDLVCPFGLRDAECWAEALTATETWEVDLGRPVAELRGDPGVNGMLFDLAHGGLARALTHVVMLGRLDGTERVCAFLADLARRIGRHGDEGLRLSLPMSREDMADYLGLNSETVSRILGRLRRDGLARFPSRSDCVIPDLSRLEDRSPMGIPVPETVAPAMQPALPAEARP